MAFQVTITQPPQTRRDQYNTIVERAAGTKIGTFTDPANFMDFVREHRAELEGAVVSSTSDSTAATCGEFLRSEVMKVEIT